MKNLLLGCLLAFSMFSTAVAFGGCALLSQIKVQPLTATQVLVILSDAQWGVSAAHDATDLTDAEYTLFEEALNVAEDAVKAGSGGYGAIAKAVLNDLLAALQTNSSLRPYVDAAINLL